MASHRPGARLATVALAVLVVTSCGSDADDGTADSVDSAPATSDVVTTPDTAVSSVPTATSDVDTSTTTSDPAPATTTATTTNTATSTSTSTTTSSTTTTSTTTSSTTTSTVPATPPAEPIVAIDADGDAVTIADPAAGPVVLFDGPSDGELDEVTEGPGPNVTDHVSVTPDGVLAFVGTCCEPAAGAFLRTEPPAVATFDGTTPGIGYNPTVSPDGQSLAVGQIAGPPIVVSGIDGGSPLPPDDGSGLDATTFTPYDVMWTAPDRLAALGLADLGAGTEWIVVAASVSGGTLVLDPWFAVGLAFDGDFEAVLKFAGHDANGALLVHRVGADTVTAHSLDGMQLDDVAPALPGPHLSAWFEPGQSPVLVDDAGVLTVGDATVAGTYAWART